jgi:hypothetical protein
MMLDDDDDDEEENEKGTEHNNNNSINNNNNKKENLMIIEKIKYRALLLFLFLFISLESSKVFVEEMWGEVFWGRWKTLTHNTIDCMTKFLRKHEKRSSRRVFGAPKKLYKECINERKNKIVSLLTQNFFFIFYSALLFSYLTHPSQLHRMEKILFDHLGDYCWSWVALVCSLIHFHTSILSVSEQYKEESKETKQKIWKSWSRIVSLLSFLAYFIEFHPSFYLLAFARSSLFHNIFDRGFIK